MEHTNVNAIEAAKQLDIINELKVRFEQEKAKQVKPKPIILKPSVAK